MGFTEQNFKNPVEMFDIRTRQLGVRIRTLQNFLAAAKHPYSRAIVKQELNRSIDEYVSRAIQQRIEKTNR